MTDGKRNNFNNKTKSSEKAPLKRAYGWFAISLFIVVCDQITKLFAQQYLFPYQPVEITSFFNLTLAYNTGAAFSFLDNVGGWQQWLFGSIAIVVTIIAGRWIITLPTEIKWQKLGLSLIIGGAIGNVLDRIFRGRVIDFLDFHLGAYHWPVFNVADSAITIGACIVIITLMSKQS